MHTDPAVLSHHVQPQCDTLLATRLVQPEVGHLDPSSPIVPPVPARGRRHRPRRTMIESGMSPRGYFETSEAAVSFYGAETATSVAIVSR